MELRHTEPSRVFVATGGGAGLNPNFPCGHGASAISLHLLSTIGGTTEDIGIILPRCAAAHLLGAALAYIKASDGQAAVDEFLAYMNKACDEASAELAGHAADHQAAKAACCEAGYRTQGREHTCRTSNPTA
ncbi:hypothetical protein [Streptomyces justiciae]|uniref:Uncharacterized protein n=1 Tax=Streptomyces justiciae TaxID=2780140 RepID=A0ABU3M776_9ACTN|nr:hypothetical protein [Streptomyces justiciae]MDT7847243.1 hypothetical protein [Streptomyces justiciae]